MAYTIEKSNTTLEVYFIKSTDVTNTEIFLENEISEQIESGIIFITNGISENDSDATVPPIKDIYVKMSGVLYNFAEFSRTYNINSDLASNTKNGLMSASIYKTIKTMDDFIGLNTLTESLNTLQENLNVLKDSKLEKDIYVEKIAEIEERLTNLESIANDNYIQQIVQAEIESKINDISKEFINHTHKITNS